MVTPGWIGVDLDGTLAYWDPAIFPEIGAPIPLMIARVKGWLAEGKEVRIVTARVAVCGRSSAYGTHVYTADTAFAADQADKILRWVCHHVGTPLPITCQKDFQMIELWDDRCVQMEMNTGRTALEAYGADLTEV